MLERYIEQVEKRYMEAGEQDSKEWEEMMERKYFEAKRIKTKEIMRKLDMIDKKGKVGEKEKEKEEMKENNQEFLEGVMSGVEYETMWDGRIRKIDNLLI